MNITHESETIITRAIESMDEIVQDCIDRGEGPRLARAIDRYNDAAGQIERTHRVSIEDFNRCIPKVGQLQKMVERIERLV